MVGDQKVHFFDMYCQGHEPVLLRTQYRCHPMISAVPNSLFYNNQLQDGIMQQDRQPILVNLPILES